MLEKEYQKKRSEIRSRLLDFKKICESSKKIFIELCFCLCTPQSKARAADEAVTKLQKTGFLSKGNETQISNILKGSGVRFHNNKAGYIVEARAVLSDINARIKKSESNKELRMWLVKNIGGLGYKEASHFLRNIGRGRGLAILDRHILKNLKEMKVIAEIPKSISGKRYLEIEGKMEKFAKRIRIPLEELDLLLWSMETGEVFK